MNGNMQQQQPGKENETPKKKGRGQKKELPKNKEGLQENESSQKGSPQKQIIRRKRPRVGEEPPIRPQPDGQAAQSAPAHAGSAAKKRGVIDGTFNGTISVVVGAKAKQYEVHKSFLIAQSKWFQDKMNTTTTKVVKLVLDEIEPHTFDRILAYLYSRNMLKDGEKYGQISWDLLIDLYLAAEYLAVPGLQNQAIDALTTKVDATEKGILPSNFLPTIFKHTISTSPLRRLAIDTYAWNLRSRVGDEGEYSAFEDVDKSDLPGEFSFELLKQLVRKAPVLRRNRIFTPVSDNYYCAQQKTQAQAKK